MKAIARHRLITDHDRAKFLTRIRAAAVDIHGQPPPDALLSANEVAELTGISAATLASWRSRGNSRVPYMKIANRIRYPLGDVLAFLALARQPAQSHGTPP